MTEARTCRHCQRRVGTHSRGLCRPCWEDPAIRALYQPAKQTRRADDGDHFGHKPASVPCPHLPGTAEHQKALADWVTKGESLYHPEDKRESLK